MDHHNIPKVYPLPESKEAMHVGLEKIFNIMVASMGEKVDKVIHDAMAYYNDLPPNVR